MQKYRGDYKYTLPIDRTFSTDIPGWLYTHSLLNDIIFVTEMYKGRYYHVLDVMYNAEIS